METYHRKHLQRNKDYKEYQHTIDSIQNALRREIPQLIQEFELTVQEATEIDEFVNDRGNNKVDILVCCSNTNTNRKIATMFRFLRKNKYSLPTSLSLLLDTIRWRILADIDKIRVSTVTEFLGQPLVYFHKTDKLNRPVLIVNLAYLPKAPAGYDVTEFLTPLVIFVLETARLLIWDMTQERTELGVKDPLIMETVVLVEFKNANALPTVLIFCAAVKSWRLIIFSYRI